MRTSALALVLCLTTAALPAAELPPVPIGARVRALATDGSQVHGILVAHGPGNLTIETRSGRDTITLNIGRIERLQVADGRKRLTGFGYGIVAGLVAAAAAGLLLDSRGGCYEGCGLILPFTIVFGIPLGAIAGTVAAPPRWREVRLPALPEASKQGLGFRVAPVRGGARFTLTYGF